jgi:F-type H+-transporting ATPase subunit gamma
VSHSTASLRRQIGSATDLHSVVRTMKAIAASSIGQYEQSVRALADYYRTVELGLGACFRDARSAALVPQQRRSASAMPVSAVVFGSDQGLVGRFNEAVADHAIAALEHHRVAPRVWAVGERVHARLVDAGLSPVGCFAVPASVNGIAALVGQILVESQSHSGHDVDGELHLFYNGPTRKALYESVSRQLLPLDDHWYRARADLPWPSKNLPEVLGSGKTLRALLSEYLFVSLFRACAESLASENASRLAAMQRADKNIDELLAGLRGDYHHLRQRSIDEELFDVIAGFEALMRSHAKERRPDPG